MTEVYQKVLDCYESIKDKIPFTPKVALVLGSGLGNYADTMEVKAEIDYHDIKNFPISTVPGHAGKFIFGYVNGVPVVCMKGRVHYYEGYPISDVVLPARLMKLMGAEILFLTNASVVTSGDYQRFYIVDGQRYHHLIDPDTLMPDTEFRSVSIITKDSGYADLLSTAAFLMPYDESRAFIESLDGVEALWCTTDGQLVTSSGWSSHEKK